MRSESVSRKPDLSKRFCSTHNCWYKIDFCPGLKCSSLTYPLVDLFYQKTNIHSTGDPLKNSLWCHVTLVREDRQGHADHIAQSTLLQEESCGRTARPQSSWKVICVSKDVLAEDASLILAPKMKSLILFACALLGYGYAHEDPEVNMNVVSAHMICILCVRGSLSS